MLTQHIEHRPDVDLWHCPCHECTRLDWDALDDDRPTLAAYRRELWPAYYGGSK